MIYYCSTLRVPSVLDTHGIVVGIVYDHLKVGLVIGNRLEEFNVITHDGLLEII